MNIKDIAFWIMLLIVIGLSIYVFHWIKTESYECVSDPYQYAWDKNIYPALPSFDINLSYLNSYDNSLLQNS